MLEPWLQSLIFSNLYFEMATVENACYIKSGDGSNALKSEAVTEKAPTAKANNWLLEAYSE
jgi:hypothetical protein